MEESDQHTQTMPPRSLVSNVFAAAVDPLASCVSLDLLSQPAEGATDSLQLLKSHKEKLEEGIRELRRKNEELERDKDEGEKERERMRRCMDQLRGKLVQAQVRRSDHIHHYVYTWPASFMNGHFTLGVSGQILHLPVNEGHK